MLEVKLKECRKALTMYGPRSTAGVAMRHRYLALESDIIILKVRIARLHPADASCLPQGNPTSPVASAGFKKLRRVRS